MAVDLYYATYAPWAPAPNSQGPSPRANIWTDDAGTKIEVELPGFSRSDIDISTKKGRLTVTAKREKSNDKNCVSREFSTTTLTRAWSLPKNTNYDGIAADLDAGILTITVPHTKVEDNTARRIEIG
jgi:HSP20 family protein